MVPNPLLNRIIARENYSRMLAVLSPKDLAVTALLLDDLDTTAAATLLGISQRAAYMRATRAGERLQFHFPHIRSLVEPAPGPNGGDL